MFYQPCHLSLLYHSHRAVGVNNLSIGVKVADAVELVQVYGSDSKLLQALFEVVFYLLAGSIIGLCS